MADYILGRAPLTVRAHRSTLRAAVAAVSAALAILVLAATELLLLVGVVIDIVRFPGYAVFLAFMALVFGAMAAMATLALRDLFLRRRPPMFLVIDAHGLVVRWGDHPRRTLTWDKIASITLKPVGKGRDERLEVRNHRIPALAVYFGPAREIWFRSRLSRMDVERDVLISAIKRYHRM